MSKLTERSGKRRSSSGIMFLGDYKKKFNERETLEDYIFDMFEDNMLPKCGLLEVIVELNLPR